jgi:YHS domain-containing protein
VIRVLLLGVLLLLVARAFWRLVDGVIEAGGGPSRDRRRQVPPPAVRLVRDPVCGTHVATASALTARAAGATHHFCSERCRSTFLGQAASAGQHR